jgi:glycine/D-amino acid oxidase-like deaminating enzyme
MSGGAHGPRVAVVGGGVLGVSTAAQLAERGARVVLFTEAGLASGASGRSLSWLNSSGRRSPEYHRLRLLGLDRHRTLATRTDSVAHVRFDGGLSWAAAGEAEGHRASFEHMRRVGYPAEWLGRDEVSTRTPGVDVTAIPDEGAVLTPREGWVDLPSLVDQLAADVVAHGGRVVTGVGRCEIVVARGAVTGVRTAAGDLVDVDAAVLATGSAVPCTVARLGVEIPDATSVGLLVRTPPVGTRLRAVLNTPRVSVRPAPGGALVLDAAWSEREVLPREDGTHEVRESTVDGLLREASAVLEGNPALTLESYGVGPSPSRATATPWWARSARSAATTSSSPTAEPRSRWSWGSCWPTRSSPASPAPCSTPSAPAASGRTSHRRSPVGDGAAGLLSTRPPAASGGAVRLGGGDGLLAAGERPCGAAVGTARPPVAVGGLLDEVAVRVGRPVTRAFERVGHANTRFLKRTPADALPRWTTGTGRWVASATVRVSPTVSARVKTRLEPVTVIRSGT